MKQPIINNIRQARDTVDTFRGVYHNIRCDEGYFYDESNLTKEKYPTAAAKERVPTLFGIEYHRPQSTSISEPEINSMAWYNERIYFTTYVYDTDHSNPILYLQKIDPKSEDADRNLITVALLTVTGAQDLPANVPYSEVSSVTAGRRKLIVMGAYMIVLPDKWVINLSDPTDQWVSPTTYSETHTVRSRMTDANGGTVHPSSTEPTSPTSGYLWADTSISPIVLRKWNSTSSAWEVIETYYEFDRYADEQTQIIPAYDLTYAVGDRILVNGIDDPYLNGFKEVSYVATGMVRVKSYADTWGGEVGVTFEIGHIPDLDFAFEHNNRLWGCVHNTEYDEIMCSALGDFKCWVPESGIASDAFYATRKGDGKYTAAIAYNGTPTFFRENSMTRVFGDEPSSFSLTETVCDGVLSGCADTLVIMDSILFYVSRRGVCVYDGSLPRAISQPIDGLIAVERAATAGEYQGKYVLCAEHYYIYDRENGTWDVETRRSADAFCRGSTGLYSSKKYNKSEGTAKLYISAEYGDLSNPTYDENNYAWSFETGYIGLEYRSGRGYAKIPEQKYLTKITFRYKSASSFTFKAIYDNGGTGNEETITVSSTALKSSTLHFVPRRCDRLRFQFSGTGQFELLSYTKTFEVGSDVTW